MDNLIKKQMRILGISEEEARQLVEDDQRIDKGEKLFELDAESEKNAKKARQAERKSPSAPVIREKKAKPEKEEICSAMMDGLRALKINDFEIINAEREFLFTFNNVKYKVVLSCPRK